MMPSKKSINIKILGSGWWDQFAKKNQRERSKIINKIIPQNLELRHHLELSLVNILVFEHFDGN